MNENHQSALNLQGRLQKFIVTETVSQLRANPCIVPEEICKIIYQTSIKGNSLITPANSHQQKSGNDSMSKREAITIKEQLKSHKESINAKKLYIFIIKRAMNLRTLRVHGRANIIQLKKIDMITTSSISIIFNYYQRQI